MLQNAYLLAKIGADTAENDRNFAEILPKIRNYPSSYPSRSAAWAPRPWGAASRPTARPEPRESECERLPPGEAGGIPHLGWGNFEGSCSAVSEPILAIVQQHCFEVHKNISRSFRILWSFKPSATFSAAFSAISSNLSRAFRLCKLPSTHPRI